MYDKGFSKASVAVNKSGAKLHQGGSVLRVIAAICGDSANNSELHRQVYDSWIKYAIQLAPKSLSIVNANTNTYQRMELSDFQQELAEGYKTVN